MGISINRLAGSFILSTAAAVFGAQGNPVDNKSDSSKSPIVKKIDSPVTIPTEDTKTKFDEAEAKKLVAKLGNSLYKERDTAYSKLLKISETLPVNELSNFYIYILDERLKPHNTEANRRLDLVKSNIADALKEKTVEGEYLKTTLDLIAVMDKKRSPHIWSEFTPVVLDVIVNKKLFPDTYYYDRDTNSNIKVIRTDPKLMEPLSKLLLSASDKDSKELQAEATRLILSLIKPPLLEHKTFVSLHDMKLKEISKLPLDEIEKGLKELKALYLQADLSYGLEAKLSHSAIPYLEQILDKNINALSTDDPKKQMAAMININALKNHFKSSNLKNLLSTKNGSLIFKSKNFSKNITSAKELQSSIKIARLISELSKNDINYHKSYVSWLEKQIDNPEIQKLPDRKEMQNTLEDSLLEELYTVKKSGYVTPLQQEMIPRLVKTYTKLAKQSSLDRAFLERNLGAIVDFQAVSYYYLDYPKQEKVHPDLLALFDTVTDNINKLKDTKEKASLRAQVPMAISYVNPKENKDYVNRLSSFYSKEINTDEFMNLTDSLLNSPDSGHVGKYLPPEIMLQFIESNPKYFEANVKHIIETYKKSNVPAVKSTSSKQLETLYLSFHCLFDEKRKTDGWLKQYFPRTNLINDTNRGNTDLSSHPELMKQIARIETWFDRELEKSISEVISSKSK